MKLYVGMAVTVMALFASNLTAREREPASRRVFLDKNGGGIEVRVNDPKDTGARDAVQKELQKSVEDQSTLSSPAMQEHQDNIDYRYERTDRGGRIRITTKNAQALRAIQDFLRTQMDEDKASKGVSFTFIRDTSLVVVPVMVNDQGPFRFLLDTGASNTILSKKVGDRLKLRGGKPHLLTTAGGQVEVTLRYIRTLQVGDARLKELEIAVSDFGLLQELQVDGILGADYLRRFIVHIDYEKQTVELEGVKGSSLLVA
jgi:hypothetical protein